MARVHQEQGEFDPEAVLRPDQVHGQVHGLREAERHVRVLLQPVPGTARQRQ